MRIAIALLIGVSLSLQASAATIRVPQDQATIQAGIDAAVNGDTVLVGSGTYNEAFDYIGKAVVVKSEFGPDSVIFTSPMPIASLVSFHSGEDTLSVLDGFTFKNMMTSGSSIGTGLVSLQGSSGTIRHCRFLDNSSIASTEVMSFMIHHIQGGYTIIEDCVFRSNEGLGGPVYLVGAQGRIRNSVFVDNTAQNIGGAMIIAGLYGTTSYLVENNLFLRNTSVGAGGAIFLSQSINTIIKNNTFIGNTSVTLNGGGAVGVMDYCSGISIQKNIFVGNNGHAVANITASQVSLSCNDAIANAPANYAGFLSPDANSFSLDPLFCDTASGIYKIGNDSPCAPANNICGVLIGAYSAGCNNVPPSFQEIDSAMAYEGDTLRLHLVANDIDSDSLHITASNLPLNSSFVDSGNGRALYVFSPDCSQAGAYLPSFIVEDDSLAADTMDVPLTVLNTNIAPVFDSASVKQVYAALELQFSVHATDFDGDSLVLSVPTPPTNTTFVDSGNGRGLLTFSPDLSQVGDYAIAFRASDGALNDTLVVQIMVLDPKPALTAITLQGSANPMHVTSQTPMIAWTSFDPVQSKTQTHSEIAVGTDNDWQFSEMWNPATFVSSDTFVVYDGAPLVDGHTYWLRLRVNNGLAWSDWSELMFRTNSMPTTPEQLLPSPGSNTGSAQPTFVVRNSFDTEVVSLYYTIDVSLDTAMSAAHSFTKKQDLDSLTSATIDIVLNENTNYFWRVRASDYYEESFWSPVHSFWVNTANSAPAAFALTSPADAFSPPIPTRTPTLEWTEAIDIDPLDVVSYSLHLALDSDFTFVSVVSGISSNQYTPASALVWGTRYWWKVKALDLNGGETWSTQVFRFRTMALGDADGSGVVTISDVVFLINYIFSGGPAPNPPSSGDADCSGAINISDAVYLIQYIFGGGAPPCEG